jgi:UDP-glucose 4-epimerase
MAKAIVTGGAGFIGSHLVETLVAKGHEVIVLDDLSHGTLENLRQVQDKIRFVQDDVCNIEDHSKQARGVEYVFHLAAETSVNKSLKEPFESAEQNIRRTLKLLDYSRKCRLKRFIFSSSAAVYGYQEELPNTEQMEIEPASPYALEKLTCESYMKLFSRLYQVDTVSLRYFNVYGPRQNADLPHPGGVTIVIRQLLGHGRSELMGDGRQTRDMIYVQDVVNANILAMEYEGNLRGEVFNVSTNQSLCISEMHEKIADLMKLEFKPRFIPFPDGNIVDSRGDNSKARDTLGFSIEFELEEGLRRTIDWYRGKP